MFNRNERVTSDANDIGRPIVERISTETEYVTNDRLEVKIIKMKSYYLVQTRVVNQH